jgi:hypothetical protein
MSSSSSASEGTRRLAAGESSVAALLVGDDGGTQSSIARELAAAWHCLSPIDGSACGECRACGAFERSATADVFLIEPGGPQDLIRLRQIVDDPAVPEPNIRGFLQSPPAVGRNRVVWIERADRLNEDAANALLKTIEEPGPRARFVLTTSASGRILPTIRSRCLLIPCESEPMGFGFLAELAGGSPAMLDILGSADFSGFISRLEALAVRIDGASLAEGVSIADEFLELSGLYTELRDEGEERLRRADFFRLFANLAGTRAGASTKWRELLDHAIVAHRAVSGNVNPTYLADWMFTAEGQ